MPWRSRQRRENRSCPHQTGVLASMVAGMASPLNRCVAMHEHTCRIVASGYPASRRMGSAIVAPRAAWSVIPVSSVSSRTLAMSWRREASFQNLDIHVRLVRRKLQTETIDAPYMGHAVSRTDQLTLNCLAEPSASSRPYRSLPPRSTSTLTARLRPARPARPSCGQGPRSRRRSSRALRHTDADPRTEYALPDSSATLSPRRPAAAKQHEMRDG